MIQKKHNRYMTEILRYKDSWVKFTDCIEGMKELPDKSVDLCLTDPPWNINYKKSVGVKIAKRKKEIHYNRLDKTNQQKPTKAYDDIIPDYSKWCEKWFKEVNRTCKKSIIMISSIIHNIHLWFMIEKPIGMLIHYKKNSPSCTSLAFHNRYDVLLLYGKWKHQFDFKCNVFDIPVSWGFLRDKEITHPHPKQIELLNQIIERLKPTSVLDPFMGSGTTLEACIQLDIPCYGFELMEEYKVDMEKRIERSKYYKKEQTLDNFIRKKT